jgi:hypothetical protein
MYSTPSRNIAVAEELMFCGDGWIKWGFTSFIFVLKRLIRSARDHSHKAKSAYGTG